MFALLIGDNLILRPLSPRPDGGHFVRPVLLCRFRALHCLVHVLNTGCKYTHTQKAF